MSITIPAREVRKGDVIDFGGQPMVVTGSDFASGRLSRQYIKFVNPWYAENFNDPGAIQAFDPDTPLNVQRPDPDAQLLEIMASGTRAFFGHSNDGHDCQRCLAISRAALTAAREAGLL